MPTQEMERPAARARDSRGRPQNVVRPLLPFPDAWVTAADVFRARLNAQNLAHRTIENYITTIRRLSIEVGKGPGDVTTADLLTRQNRGISASSMASERICYRRFFGLLVEEEMIEHNPAARLPKVRVRKGRPRPLSTEQVELLLSGVPGGRPAYRRTRAIILLAAYQGWRIGEIARTRGEDFDLELDRVHRVAKGGYEREQPIHPAVRNLAMSMPRRGWWFPNARGDGHVLVKSVSSLISRRLRAVGIDDPRITGHSLRHYFGTELAKAGVDIRTIQELMGHELLTSTQIYTQVDTTMQSDALIRLPQLRTGERRRR